MPASPIPESKPGSSSWAATVLGGSPAEFGTSSQMPRKVGEVIKFQASRLNRGWSALDSNSSVREPVPPHAGLG